MFPSGRQLKPKCVYIYDDLQGLHLHLLQPFRYQDFRLLISVHDYFHGLVWTATVHPILPFWTWYLWTTLGNFFQFCTNINMDLIKFGGKKSRSLWHYQTFFGYNSRVHTLVITKCLIWFSDEATVFYFFYTKR